MKNSMLIHKDGRLAGQKVLEPEHLLGARQAALVGQMASSENAATHQHQHAQRPPEPAQPDGRRHCANQDGLLVHVHVDA
jgi:hypothetical protein